MILNIFKDKKLEIDLPNFIDSRALICANSGGGKSYAIRKILEESSNKVMSIVLDVEGEFRTLRERFDFLLIGSEGDIELNMKAAKLLPKKIIELEVSTIVDISDLKRNERIKYVKEFLEALMDLPRKGGYWKPCLVIVDEAHLLAGQQEKQDSCSAVIDLMTRGRKRGYCGILCTQRIAKLHKDAVAEANNIMIGRTGLDIDMKRASEILGFTSKTDMLSLRDLEAGEFYVFGTAISKHVTKAFVSEVKTTHPQVGIDLRKKIIKPTAKVIKILSKLKDLPHIVEKELKELNDYKKEVMELKREIRVLEHSKPKLEKIEIIKADEGKMKEAYEKGSRDMERKYQTYVRPIEQNTSSLKVSIIKLIKNANSLLESRAFSLVSDKPIIETPDFKSTIRKQIQPMYNIPQKTVTTQAESIVTDNGEYIPNICAKRIYSLLFENPDKEFTKVQIALLTGYSIKSSGFINSISQLNVNNLMKKVGKRITLGEVTPELATEKIGEFSKDLFMKKLHKCPRDVFKFLLENPEQEFSKEELADNTNYSVLSSGFINAISKLNVLELINRNDGIIRLNPEIWEIGV